MPLTIKHVSVNLRVGVVTIVSIKKVVYLPKVNLDIKVYELYYFHKFVVKQVR